MVAKRGLPNEPAAVAGIGIMVANGEVICYGRNRMTVPGFTAMLTWLVSRSGRLTRLHDGVAPAFDDGIGEL